MCRRTEGKKRGSGEERRRGQKRKEGEAEENGKTPAKRTKGMALTGTCKRETKFLPLSHRGPVKIEARTELAASLLLSPCRRQRDHLCLSIVSSSRGRRRRIGRHRHGYSFWSTVSPFSRCSGPGCDLWTTTNTKLRPHRTSQCLSV